MALIKKDNFKKSDKSRVRVHETVKATYTVFEDDGIKYFQIDTYGSDYRQDKDTLSQSIQVDKDTAKYLIGLLVEIL